MRYLPHTQADIDDMLAVAGADSMEGLFASIPKDCLRKAPMVLPEPLTEWELNRRMNGLSASMAVSPEYQVYLGAGSYEHFVPQIIPYLLSRSEFCTAYTPYQPEISQGTLQAIFEYQTLTARLLGMEVSNASLYDGASALAEAMLMAVRITRRSRVAISRLVHPFYRQVVRTYLEPSDCELIELPYMENGRTDTSPLEGMDDVAGIAVQSPNFFGCIEDLESIAGRIHSTGGLMVACFTEPIAYGMLKSPGSLGADIACGEGQSLGLPQSLGGPGLGMLACKKDYMRSIPGRLVGQTTDVSGKRGFVLTLATREQHIRREKATSNICTNSNLCAVGAAMYMASLGGKGLNQLARLNHDKSDYLKTRLGKEAGIIPFSGPTFNEFVVKFSPGFESVYTKLLERRIVAGLSLERFYPELSNHYLMCVTETKTRTDLDAFVKEVISCQNR